MSKEEEVINEYIAQQQKRINELMQHNMMLETRNNVLFKELEDLKNINSRYEEKIDALSFQRDGISSSISSSNFMLREDKQEPIFTNKTKISGKKFTKNNMHIRRD
tara:strand:+ start:291 stop:608 length:318 start_codon:yes stop_codon:yes gene_type:complete